MEIPISPELTYRQEVETRAGKLIEQCGYKEALFQKETPIEAKSYTMTEEPGVETLRRETVRVILNLIGEGKERLKEVRPELTINQIVAQVYSFYPKLAEQFIKKQALARALEEKLYPGELPLPKIREKFLTWPYQNPIFSMGEFADGIIIRDYLDLLQTTRGFRESQKEQGEEPTILRGRVITGLKSFLKTKMSLIDEIIQARYFPHESARGETNGQKRIVLAGIVCNLTDVNNKEIRELLEYCSEGLRNRVLESEKDARMISSEVIDPRLPQTSGIQREREEAEKREIAERIKEEERREFERFKSLAVKGDIPAMVALNKLFAESQDPKIREELERVTALHDQRREKEERLRNLRNKGRSFVRGEVKRAEASTDIDEIKAIIKRISLIYEKGVLKGLPESERNRDYFLDKIKKLHPGLSSEE